MLIIKTMVHNPNITIKEKRFLEACVWINKTHGRKPSLSELARTLGYKSVNSVRQFISSLHLKGVNPDSYKATGYIPQEFKSTVLIPILGRAPCGNPFLAQENWEGQIPVDTSLIKGNSREYFFLKAVGQSMNLAGINDGDYVLFLSQPTASPGDKVVVLIGDEATIKIYKPGEGNIALVPKSSDPNFKPIIVSEDLTVQGVVKSVVKKEMLES